MGYIIEFPLCEMNNILYRFMLVFDWISLGFVNFVALIAGLVMFYRNMYIHGDLNEKRFILLVNLFVFFIWVLIFSPNILSLILGWDGLGLVSFLLVIHYYNTSTLKSGLITIYTNRLGDAAVVFGLYFFLRGNHWCSFSLTLRENWLAIGIMIILAGMTKRAQLPFSAWLPAAIAAPTPVSSLVHSSTLVTAGVYLVLRFYYILHSYLVGKLFCLFFILTSLLAGLIACFELDLKRVVAISTLSQLGLMLFILSIGDWLFCYYHMVCHALFKALLFIRCGVVIIISFGNQDIRLMGGLGFSMPVTRIVLCFSSMSLFGFPFLTGFYSKDLILESSFFYEEYFFYIFLLVMCCVITTVYSYRLFKLGFSFCWGNNSFTKLVEDMRMLFGILVLCFWSICLGRVFGYSIFINYLPLLVIREKIMGMFILLIGSFFYFISVNFGVLKMVKEFFNDMGFLNWLSSGMLSVFIYFIGMGVKGDYLWGEIFGSKGVNKWLSDSFLKDSHLLVFYGLKMSILVGAVWGILFIYFYLLCSLYRVQSWSGWGKGE